MKINPAPLHLAQDIINGLVVALSVAVLGTSAHTLAVFNKQQTINPWWMPMWPQHFNSHGTKGLVASSVVTLVLCGGLLIASFVPKVAMTQKYTFRALLSLGTLVPSLFVAIAAVVYAHILNSNSPDLDTIQTWSCRYKSSQPIKQDMSVPGNLGNWNFDSVCRESKFALWGTLIGFLLLSMGVGLTMVTWLADKLVAREQRKEVA